MVQGNNKDTPKPASGYATATNMTEWECTAF